jgi:hypothetical protein
VSPQPPLALVFVDLARDLEHVADELEVDVVALAPGNSASTT